MSEAVFPIVRGPDGKIGIGNVRFTPVEDVAVRNEVHISGDVSPSSLDAMRMMLEASNCDLLRSLRGRYAVLGDGCLDGGHKARAAAKQARIDAITKAPGVMPSDAPRVLSEANAKRALSWNVDPYTPVSGGRSILSQVPTAEVLCANHDEMRAHLKPARTLPGALSEASGGHRLGGWGAT